MDIYNCTVNLNSKAETQVELKDVTATEILILRAIHNDPTKEDVGGMEPVVNVKYVGEDDRSDEEERERLLGAGENNLGVSRYRLDQFKKVFSHESIPFPQTLKGFEKMKELGNHPNSLANLKLKGKKAEEAELMA